ncbi:hypothetical protein GGR50DRAFT_150791 [Xylaria sp. CBS 124048]|nr:hypothetical protein GGR50DRAFT_150791 [Xylaria sp. CBS 124048]
MHTESVTSSANRRSLLLSFSFPLSFSFLGQAVSAALTGNTDINCTNVPYLTILLEYARITDGSFQNVAIRRNSVPVLLHRL